MLVVGHWQLVVAPALLVELPHIVRLCWTHHPGPEYVACHYTRLPHSALRLQETAVVLKLVML